MSDSLRILVLEDDAEMRQAVRETLEEEGYDVCAVGSGVEAIEQVKSAPFDLVVADVRMDGMDGLTAIEHVRELTPGIRSLVVSGYCNEADTLRALRLGVGDFIKKPFALQDLLDAVRRQVVQKQVEEDKQADREAFSIAAMLALEAQAQLVDEHGGKARFARIGGLARSAPWAEALALHQELDGRTAQSCALLCLLWAVSKLRPDPRLERLQLALPESLRTVLAELREGRRESPVARLVRGVLRFAELGDKDTESLVNSGVDPILVESLKRLEENGLESADLRQKSRQHGQQRRGLMALAGALEGKGDHAGAHAAYKAVLAESEVSLETVEACLGIARVLRSRGHREESLEQAREAVQAASRLGPNTLAVTQSQAAILAFDLDRRWSLKLLRDACCSLAGSGASAELTKARLALWALDPSSLPQEEVAEILRELTRPVYSDELALCALWLAPALLERYPQMPEAEQALFQIARLFPGEYQRLLRAEKLCPQARANLVPILARAANDGSRKVLETIAREQDSAGLAAWHAARPGKDDNSTLIRLYTLGAFAVYRGEDRISDKAWKRVKNRLFFARLAAAGSPVSEDILIEEFWPGDADKGRQNVYSAVSVTRRCLTQDEGGRVDAILRSGLGLCLSPELPLWHDLREVQENLQEAAQCGEGREQEAYERLKRVHKLYKGPYLEGCYQDWALSIRHSLENDILVLFGKLCGWLEAQRRGDELAEFARWMLGIDPCCQQAHISVMRSLLLTERPEEAVRHFERTRTLLAQELAMEPSIELLREHQKALLSLP
jgi:DNA-binding response OmpR family regulator/DNA-binding SARP family transcriptional activator